METKRMSNYEIMKRQMQKEFLKYDQEKMIRKFQLPHDPDYIYINFISRKYRIHRTCGKVEWSDDGFIHSREANYNEAMTIYDVLCYSRDDCKLAGEFTNMKNLSTVHSASAALGGGLFRKTEKSFDHKDQLLSQACHVHAEVGEFLDCRQDVDDTKCFTDRDDFREVIMDSIAYDFKGTDDELEKEVERLASEYDPYWKSCIILFVGN